MHLCINTVLFITEEMETLAIGLDSQQSALKQLQHQVNMMGRESRRAAVRSSFRAVGRIIASKSRLAVRRCFNRWRGEKLSGLKSTIDHKALNKVCSKSLPTTFLYHQLWNEITDRLNILFRFYHKLKTTIIAVQHRSI